MFGNKKTVDSVVSKLTKIVEDLDTVSLYNRGVALDKNSAATQLVLEADEASSEAQRADSVKAKLADLLGM